MISIQLSSCFRSRLGWAAALACLLAASLAHRADAAPALNATWDRDTIAAGESAVLRLTFTDGEPRALPQIVPPPGLTIGHIGQSQQISITGGRRTFHITHNFQVTASQPGDYQLPAIQVQINNTTLSAQPPPLKVVKASERAAPPGGNQLALLRLVVGKSEVFLGEIFPVEIQLFYQSAQEVQMPQLKSDGFTIGKTAKPVETRTQIGNTIYNVAIFKMSVIAAKTGDLTLGPAECNVVLRVPRARSNDPFEFFGQRFDLQRATLTSEPFPLRVLPLPTENRPPDFSGAVGQFTLGVNASPTNVAVGDPITLNIQISGSGNLDAVSVPAVEAWREFKAYPPSSKIETSDPLGMQGTKRIEQVVVPENASLRELPPITLSFFDPESRSYQTAASQPIPLAVRPASAAPAQPTITAPSAAPGEQPAARDIVHIKPRPGRLQPAGPPLIRQPWFVAVQGIPVLAFLAVVVWRRQRDKLENNPRLRRRQETDKTIEAGLRDLRRHASERDAAAFYTTAFRLLQERLGERLDLPASAITEEVIDERLLAGDISDSLRKELHDLFQACNQARYSAQGSARELDSVLSRLEKALAEARQLPAKVKRGDAALATAAACLLIAAAPSSLAAGGDPPAAFEQANKLYEQGHYARAAEAYQRISETAGVSPALYFNLGNALFKAGEIGRAIYNYRLAQRLAPRDPDIQANLRFARNTAAGGPFENREASPWMAKLTLNEWALLFMFAFWLCAALLIARQVGPEWTDRLRPATVVSGSLAAGFCVCLLLAWRLQAQKEAVVVASEAVARYGPLKESQQHFLLHDGAEVLVRDRKDGWVQVRGPGEKPGWVEEEKIKVLP